MFVQQTAHLRVFSCTTGTLDWKHLNSYLRASLSERERPSCKKTFFSRIHTFIPLNISYGNSLYKDTYKRKNESRHEMYMLTMNSDTCWCFVLVTKNTSSCISFSLFTVPMAFPVLTIYIALYIYVCVCIIISLENKVYRHQVKCKSTFFCTRNVWPQAT